MVVHPSFGKGEPLKPKSRDVVFPILPFSQLGPALDASLIAAQVESFGISTEIKYFNLEFANTISVQLYDEISAEISLDSLLGDWIFGENANTSADRDYLTYLVRTRLVSEHKLGKLLETRQQANGFIQSCVDRVGTNVEVICLADTFAKRDAVAGQFMASLAFASEIKRRRPSITTIVVGPSTEGSMGREIAQLPMIDYVISSNRVVATARLIRSLSANEVLFADPDVIVAETRSARIPNVSQSSTIDSSRLAGPADAIIPNFDDYFALGALGLPGNFSSIPLSMSSGCWWGERSHCIFCGLNGTAMAYQPRQTKSILNELMTQIERYNPALIELSDLISGPHMFTSVFPAVAAMNADVEFFLETRPTLTSEELDILVRARVRHLQAGVESLSPKSLKRLRKGFSARTALRFLERCRERGLDCYWNYLHSIPGEAADDALDALPFIEQAGLCQPPASFHAVRVVRFSPLHLRFDEFGISTVRPGAAYQLIYGHTTLDLMNFAYYFDYDLCAADTSDHVVNRRVLSSAITGWNKQHVDRST